MLDKLPQKDQAAAHEVLTAIPDASTTEEAERPKKDFQAWCATRGHAEAGRRVDHDGERTTTFSAFPKEHGKHLRTTNVVESPFAGVRLRTSAAQRSKKATNATAVIWKTLRVAEQSCRRLNAPELVAEGAEGAVSVNGVRVKKGKKRVPA